MKTFKRNLASIAFIAINLVIYAIFAYIQLNDLTFNSSPFDVYNWLLPLYILISPFVIGAFITIANKEQN